ncbi:DNA-directed RNA polymerase subunit beta [Sporosarcina sp. P18a]|uniref:DNA-directed RNA polymerase subunit beta n=1 Tax=Sporosarcina sp. P18a TaxID=2048259 RepID=UPI001E627E30|nr:DNA-directed RNA polymerase subunit beta [Sporosarcina sp. P18a]
MTDKNFKKITEPLSPVKPFEPLKTAEPTEMEDPIELTETDPVVTPEMDEVAVTLAEPPTTDGEVLEDIQPITETEALETTPDASEEVVEPTPLIETEPVEKLPAPEQTDATFWDKIASKWPRKERSKKSTKPISEMRWVQVRMIPIWLRLLLILLLIILAAIAGTMVGFSVIGDGQAGDVFKKETWQHIFDIMNGK